LPAVLATIEQRPLLAEERIVWTLRGLVFTDNEIWFRKLHGRLQHKLKCSCVNVLTLREF